MESAAHTAPAGARAASAAPGTPQAHWIEPLSNALVQLRTGISGAKLYTLGSQQFMRIAENVLQAWQPVLQQVGALNFNVDHGETVVNGERVVLSAHGALAARNLESAMHDASVRSLNFTPGLHVQELAAFMQALGRNTFGSTDGKEINQNLRAQGVDHITVNEVTYVAIGEGESVTAGAGGGTSLLGAGHLSRTVGNLVDSLAHVSDETARAQLRARTAEEIVAKDLGMAAEILEAAWEAASARGDWHPADPQRDAACLAALGGMARAGFPDNGEAAAKMMSLLLEPYENRPHAWPTVLGALEPSLYLLAPPWVGAVMRRNAEAGPSERAAELLRMPACVLLEAEAFAEVRTLMAELREANDAASYMALAERLAEDCRAARTGERQQALKELLELAAEAPAGPFGLHQKLEGWLAEDARHETNLPMYRSMLTYLAARVRANHAAGEWARARALVDSLLAFHSNVNEVLGSDGTQAAAEVRASLVQEDFIRQILDAAAAHPENKDAALGLLAGLGPAAHKHFPAVVLACTDASRMRTLVDLLRGLGQAAVEPLLEVLGKERDAARADRLLAACEGLTDLDLFWVQMPHLLAHEGAPVRVRAERVCTAHRNPTLFKVLGAAMRTEHDERRLFHFVGALAEWRDKAGIAILGEVVSRENLSDALRIEALDALALTKDPSIVPFVAPLIHHAQQTKGLTGMLRRGTQCEAPKAVRVAAIEALGMQHRLPDVQALLGPLRSDSSLDQEASRAVVAVLNGLVKAVRKPHRAHAPSAAACGLHPHAKTRVNPFDAFGAGPAAHAAPHPAAPAIPPPPGARPRERTRVFDPFGAPKPATHAHDHAPVPAAPLQGSLKDHTLHAVLQSCGHKDGLFIFHTHAGEGRVYLANAVILEAMYQGKYGMDALAALAALLDAEYRFVPDAGTHSQSMAVPVATMAEALAKHKPGGATGLNDVWGGRDL